MEKDSLIPRQSGLFLFYLVEIEMPKYLINDVRQGSYELEDQDIDLDDLDQSYIDDLDKAHEEEQDAE